MRRFKIEQLSFLPGTSTARSWKLKPAPRQDEEKLMRQLKDAAALLGLPSVHISYYCGNKFYVRCSHCGNIELAECRKRNNQENAGLPDLCGISWGIETKRDRNQRGDPFEPSDMQTATHEWLRRAGVPVIVAHPGNLQETISFLQNISRERLNERKT
jgi:hypothetical protein